MKENYTETYTKALNNFIDLSSQDITAQIAKEHGLVGLARLEICLKELNIGENAAHLIALPDFTYTRNKLRWDAGFPYGCIIKIDNPHQNFIPLEFRPNCCGVILCEIPKLEYDILALKKQFEKILDKNNKIDTNDFNKRNHFIGVYKSIDNEKLYALLHGSFKYIKNNLYTERDNKWKNKIKSMKIMDRDFLYLIDDDAKQYYLEYKNYETESSILREAIMKELFGENIQTIFNDTHEGFKDINTILLGAYASDNPFHCPIMLSPNDNLFYVSIDNSIVLHNQNKIFCSPHGGGYELLLADKYSKINSGDYLLQYPNNCKMITSNIIDMPFNYRNNSVQLWKDKYNVCQIVLELIPIINLKI